MNELRIFSNDEFGKIRTTTLENEPWFAGKDVAEILGYSNHRKALIDHVDDEDKGVTKCDTLGGKQDLTVINESGLYSLILSSHMPNAKKFKRWVTHDVLPSIRKHGAYMSEEVIEKTLNDPDYLIQLATTLKTEKAKRMLAEAQVENDKPKVLFADTVSASQTSVLIGELAKQISQEAIRDLLIER